MNDLPPTAQAALQHLLLDLLSPIRPVPQERIDALTELDWQTLLTLLQQQRLAPLLEWQLGQAHAGLRLPQHVVQKLAQASRRATLRSLELRRELVLAQRALQGAGIVPVALKGAFLAFHAYPQPQLRPMRDLDLLVPPAQAMAAYEALLAHGFKRIDGYEGTPQAALEAAKHLPPLASANGRVSVELHGRLFDPLHSTALAQGDPSLEAAFWQRCLTRSMSSEATRFESPTDLLLHLLVHGVLDHEFNNGPLLLSDIAFLLTREAIDWPLFWSLAARCGATAACRLALQLTQRYWGPQPVYWAGVDAAVDDVVLEAAALLLLRDPALKQHTHLHGLFTHAPSLRGRVGGVLRRVFPSRTWMAAAHPASADSWQLLAYHYPARWWRLLTQRLPSYWRSRRSGHFNDDAARLATLHRWLGSQ